MTWRMLARIAWGEWTQLARDGRLAASGLLLLVLLVASLGASMLHVRAVRTEREAAQHTTYRQWLEQGRRNAHSATHYGLYAFKPQSLLAVVDPGLDPVTGIAVFLESHKRHAPILRPARDKADVWRLADLTAAAVLQLLVPLWILLLTFVSLAGGRESGHLRYLVSFGVPPEWIGLGLALGTAGMVAVLAVPAAVIGALVIVVTHTGDLAGISAGRVATLAAGYVSSFAVFLAMGLTVSARARTARMALLTLLALWATGGLLLPRAVTDLASRLHPLPSKLEFVHDVDRRLLEAEHDRTTRLRARTLADHGVDRVEQLPFNFTGIDLQDAEEAANAVFDRMHADLQARMDAQTRIHLWSSLVSPLQAIRLFSMGLAGTDHLHERHFTAAAEEYRRLMVRLMNEAVRDRLGEVDESYVGTQTLNRMVGREVWARVPPFAYTPPTVAMAVWGVRGAVVGLLVWTVAALGAAAWALRRLSIDT